MKPDYIDTISGEHLYTGYQGKAKCYWLKPFCDVRHRVDGPAIEGKSYFYYCQLDENHRLDGPSFISLDTGAKEWWIAGKLIWGGKIKTDFPAKYNAALEEFHNDPPKQFADYAKQLKLKAFA